MILILFCVVIINFSRFFNDEIIVYNIIFFRIFNSFYYFKIIFKIIFWSLHCRSKFIFLILHYDFISLIVNFHVRLLLIQNAIFTF